MAALVAGGEFTQGAVLDDLPWGLRDGPLGIVLTNPCDLVWEKASYVVVAALIDAKDVIQSSKEAGAILGGDDGSGGLSRNQWVRLEKVLKQYVYNADITRYFLVEARVLTLPPLMIDFQNVLSVPIRQVSRDVQAVLPSPYREQMIVHYASYVSRIAVDRVEGAELDALIRELAVPHTPP